jgi:hypothetical protein
VLEYFKKYGTLFFSKEAIWDIDWVISAKIKGYENPESFKDPRSKFQKLIHSWLKKTQLNYGRLDVRIISKILKVIFKR